MMDLESSVSYAVNVDGPHKCDPIATNGRSSGVIPGGFLWPIYNKYLMGALGLFRCCDNVQA